MMLLYISILLVIIWECTCDLSVYRTPALDDQFKNFVITKSIPEDGAEIGGAMQDPVLIEGSHVIFQFKGVGNALILFQKESDNGPLIDVFMVEIGGGGETNNSRVGIYKSRVRTNAMASMTVPDLTNESEYRYFWIWWTASNLAIQIGRGHVVSKNVILFAITLDRIASAELGVISFVSISTTSSNSGYWRFNIPVVVTTMKPTMTAFTRNYRTYFGNSTVKTEEPPWTILSTTHHYLTVMQVQTSVGITSQNLASAFTGLKSSISTLANQITWHAGKVSSVTVCPFTVFVSSICSTTDTLSTVQDNYRTYKNVLDKPGNVAAIAVTSLAALSGAMGIVGYLIKKRCTVVNLMGQGADDEEANDRDFGDNKS